MEDNIVLNLSSVSDSNNNSQKQPKTAQIKGKRKYQEENVDSLPGKKYKKASRVTKDHQPKSVVTKVDNKSKRFSSLFRNNPDIPKVENVKVAELREDVFSRENFSDLGLHQHLVKGLEKRMNVSKLTAVQKRAIPQILQGKDVLVKSQTGSGKTLCYAVPIVERLQSARPKIARLDGPYAIIISPTRELTRQSYDTIEKLAQSFVWVVPGLIMGGEKKSKEKARLRKGLNIVFATPGRMLDHLYNTKSLCVEKVKYLVIDEADRMLDMGFEKEISDIVSILKTRCPSHMQTILLSATLSEGIDKLAGISLENPEKIDVADANTSSKANTKKKNTTSHDTHSDSAKDTANFTTPDSLKHHYVIVPSKLRLVTLAAFVLWKAKYSSKHKKLVVFLTTQFSVDFHHKVLSHILSSPEAGDSDLSLFRLHGDMAQRDRTQVFQQFTKTESGVLLCTDVAARGLNLENVRWIVQYNTPGKATDYIHRVGRTARIGRQGHALIFLCPSEVEYLKVLQNMHIHLHEMKMEDILKTLMIDVEKWAQLERCTPNTPQECATAVQVGIETYIQESKDMRTLARKAYQSFIRAYTTYPTSMKYIFHVKYLHLGHVAKSFGLQEAPKHIANVVSTNIGLPFNKRSHSSKQYNSSAGSSRDHHHHSHHPESSKRPKLDPISEFSSGLEGIEQHKSQGRATHKSHKHKHKEHHHKKPHKKQH